jgi:tRNA (guanine37-N1)-methyltransferase
MDHRLTFTIVSLFPEIIERYFETSIMAKAVDAGKVMYNLVQIRDFATDRHRSCDDAPYGGGPGMVLLPEPLAGALDSVSAKGKRTIYMTPSGRQFGQQYAEDLSKEDELVIICGRYEGIDQRIIDSYVDDEISIGDYILSSGEVAALAVIDSVYRLLSGVINEASHEVESFSSGLLEYPHYTRPAAFRGMQVPEVLINGNHREIDAWRLKESVRKTMKYRPDLLKAQKATAEIHNIADSIRNEDKG